ncbi:amidohydrolase [Staphylococcus agnetis]|uniref:amidohydrolase n=1 Tax=Staphylococcus agnetis TaxID=985762 RepID=UPI0011886855|nr:amidohydrolase [Staphylococcus agnetis]QDW98128.1 amidohydrolase [Staphylococcus agnetis]
MSYRFDQMVSWRRHFHMYPERSNEEFQTTKRLKAILRDMDVSILDVPLQTGLIAEVGQGDSMIAIRSDIDALPIHEQATVAFKSRTEGVMHACGHDIHMASVLGTVERLKTMESKLNGRVRIIFQASEELGFGANRVVETGVLNGAKAILGFHNDPTLKVGQWRSKIGIMTSNVDRFKIIVHAKGAHAAMPQDAKDPSIIVAQLIQSFQSIVSRNIAPYEEAVVTIGQIHSGQTWNVIPDHAIVEGTVRTFDHDTQLKVETRMKQICKGVATQFDTKIDLEYLKITKAVNNEEALHQLAVQAAKEAGYDVAELVRPLTIGEDFSGYQAIAPSYFAMIGSESDYPLHHPLYQPDERIFENVTDYFVNAIQLILKSS